MARQPAAGTHTVGAFAETFESVVDNVSRVLQGKEDPTRLALVCLAAEGHLLLEDVPGVGKTSLAKALARSFDLEWRRIQFTPDLLPSDVTGASVYDRDTGSFTFRPGGVFANVVLADEINRASPKTQSALLEAMQEAAGHGGQLHPPPAFAIPGDRHAEPGGARGHVPSAREPTRPLPHAGTDGLSRPDGRDGDAGPARVRTRPSTTLPAVAGPGAIPSMVALAGQVHVAGSLKGYIVDLATATRNHPALSLGMSPRAALGAPARRPGPRRLVGTRVRRP